jgi:hypothetical protein
MTYQDEMEALWRGDEGTNGQEPISENDPEADGAAVLDDVYAAVTSFIIWPNEAAARAYVLWIAATHAQPAWEHATRFVIKSPLKRCGKTRAQEVGRELVHQPLSTTNISVAALVRSIDEKDPPTLILDEADSIFGRKGKETREGAEDLRGILNSGHSRDWPYLRWDAASRQRESCPTFAMALIGGIGDMPDTIEDRAAIVSMRRRAPGESIRQFRRRERPALHQLRDRLHAWVSAHRFELENAEPELPVEDREADVWEPLVAIGDLAGGEWPRYAHDACEELCGTDDIDGGTASERLLADMQEIWTEPEDLFTTTILERLHKIDEAPWCDWYGKPLTARGLATLLRPYGVRSGNIRRGDEQAKGYTRAALADCWRRYVPPVPPSKTAEGAGHDGDGSGTDRFSGSVPVIDQGIPALRDAGTAGTEVVPKGAHSWLGDQLAAIDPADPEHGIQVARVRAAEVERRRSLERI